MYSSNESAWNVQPSLCTFGSFHTELDVEEVVVLVNYAVTNFLLFQCNFNKFPSVFHQFEFKKIKLRNESIPPMPESLCVVFLFQLHDESPQTAEWLPPICVSKVLQMLCHHLGRVLRHCALPVQVHPHLHPRHLHPHPHPLHHCPGHTQELLQLWLPQPQNPQQDSPHLSHFRCPQLKMCA